MSGFITHTITLSAVRVLANVGCTLLVCVTAAAALLVVAASGTEEGLKGRITYCITLTERYIIPVSLFNRCCGYLYYVGTVNGPTFITRLAVWKMYQKVASFSFLDTPPKNRH